MTHASADMHAYYAARAPIYDMVYRKPERAQDIAFLRTHLPHRLAGREVLEVACGTGFWTQYLAPVARRLVATDGTAEPLAFARLRPHTAGVAFHLADAYALPSSLGSFDAAFAGLWFSHVPIGSRTTFLTSLHARLRPGARVVLLENSKAQLRDFPIAETDADGNTWQHRTLPDGSVHRVLKNFPNEHEIRALLGDQVNAFEYRVLDNFWLCEYELGAT